MWETEDRIKFISARSKAAWFPEGSISLWPEPCPRVKLPNKRLLFMTVLHMEGKLNKMITGKNGMNVGEGSFLSLLLSFLSFPCFVTMISSWECQCQYLKVGCEKEGDRLCNQDWCGRTREMVPN